jgi:hypothetical protein
MTCMCLKTRVQRHLLFQEKTIRRVKQQMIQAIANSLHKIPFNSAGKKTGGYELCSKIDIDSISHLKLWSIIGFDLSQSRVPSYLV